MATNVQDRVFALLPVAQIVVAVAGVASAVVSGLPEQEFHEAVGRMSQLGKLSSDEVYRQYGGIARFLPTLLDGLYRNSLGLGILFVLLLLIGVAYVVAREAASREDVKSGGAIILTDPIDLVPQRPAAINTTTKMLLLSAGSLALLQIVTYPWFIAPRSLVDLWVRTTPAVHQARSGVTGFVSGWATGRESYLSLYSSFFAVTSGQAPEFPGLSDGLAQLQTVQSLQPTRGVPNSLFAERLLGHYRFLVTSTVSVMLALVAIALFASATMTGESPRIRWVFTILVSWVTVMHLFQWMGLVTAYGRLYIPAKAVKSLPDASVPVGNPRQWPFAKLKVEGTTEAPHVLRLRNFWPVRYGDAPLLAVRCQQYYGDGGRWVQVVNAGERIVFEGDTAVFESVKWDVLRRECRELRRVLFYDGYSSPADDVVLPQVDDVVSPQPE